MFISLLLILKGIDNVCVQLCVPVPACLYDRTDPEILNVCTAVTVCPTTHSNTHTHTQRGPDSHPLCLGDWCGTNIIYR